MDRALKLQPGSDIGEFMELAMKPGAWDRSGIPEHGCRLRLSTFEDIILNGGHYDADELIRGLMDWLDVTDDPAPAIATLRQMLDRHYPADGRTSATCAFADENGARYRFIIGAVDLSRELIAWQRNNMVFALAQASQRDPGRIVLAAPHPLPLGAALRILGVTMECFMDEPFDSFAGAVRASGSTSNFYAWERDELTTCHWPHGLGMRERGGSIIDCRHELHPISRTNWLPPSQVAMMVAIAAGYAGV